MAELILTQEEKETTWAKLDNETLGKIVKCMTFSLAKHSLDTSDNDKPFFADDEIAGDMIMHAAIVVVCCRLYERRIRKNIITLEDVTTGDEHIGDWRVTYERINLSLYPIIIFKRLWRWLLRKMEN
jgi:hypothetical protein